MSNIEFKPMGKNIYTLTKTVDGKTSTITIIDSNGNGLDNNDKFSVTGDVSVFTSKELKDKFAEQNFYKGDSAKADTKIENTVTKDGKIEIQTGKEYSLESLVKSLPEEKATSTATTTVDVAAIQEQLKNKLSMVQSQMQLQGATLSNTMLLSMYGAPGALESFQNTSVRFGQMMTSFVDILNPQGATTETPAAAPAPAFVLIKTADAQTPPTSTANSVESAAPAPAPGTSETPTPTEKAKKESEDLNAKLKQYGIVPDRNDNATTLKQKITVAELYGSSPKSKELSKSILELKAMRSGDHKTEIDKLQKELNAVKDGTRAKEKEAELEKLFETAFNDITRREKYIHESKTSTILSDSLKSTLKTYQGFFNTRMQELSQLETAIPEKFTASKKRFDIIFERYFPVAPQKTKEEAREKAGRGA